MLNVSRERCVQIQEVEEAEEVELEQDCQSDEGSTLALSSSNDQLRCQISQMLSGYILSNSVEKMISSSSASDIVGVKNRCVVIVVNTSLIHTSSSGPRVMRQPLQLTAMRPQLPLLDWRLAWPIPGEKAEFKCRVNASGASDYTRRPLLLKSLKPESLIQTVLISIEKGHVTRISMRCGQIQEKAFNAYISLLGFKSGSVISCGIFWATSDPELKWASLCLQKYTTLPKHVYKLLGRVAALSSPSSSPALLPSPLPSNARADLKYAQCPELSLPGEIVRFLRISQMMQ